MFQAPFLMPFGHVQVTWLGLTPVYLAESFSVICWLLLLMPCTPGTHHPLLQARSEPAHHSHAHKIGDVD